MSRTWTHDLQISPLVCYRCTTSAPRATQVVKKNPERFIYAFDVLHDSAVDILCDQTLKLSQAYFFNENAILQPPTISITPLTLGSNSWENGVLDLPPQLFWHACVRVFYYHDFSRPKAYTC